MLFLPAVKTVSFILSETRVLPQGSSGTGQFQDWTGGYAADISKHGCLNRRSDGPLALPSSTVAKNRRVWPIEGHRKKGQV